MGIGGLGTLLVGLFPENTIVALHILGAALPFSIGNLGIVILGLALDIPRSLRAYTLLTGTVALMALVLLISRHYLGLGPGGMERLTAYPQSTWLIVFGIYMSRSHFRNKAQRKTIILGN